jgi:hypothetical protein
MREIAGGVDLFSEQKFPGQLRGPMAVPMLQEIIDTQWGNLYQHIGQRMSKVKEMRVNRVKEYYPPFRTMHYTDRSMKDEVFIFQTSDILRSGTDYSITVERGSLVPELRALREARIREHLQSPLSVLYIDERTGKIDKEKIASDLEMGDIGREAKESQYRKLGMSLVERLWQGQQLPPHLPMPFWNLRVIMDELEGDHRISLRESRDSAGLCGVLEPLPSVPDGSVPASAGRDAAAADSGCGRASGPASRRESRCRSH